MVYFMENLDVMWVKRCHKPLMTGYLPPVKMVMTGDWFTTVLPTLKQIWGTQGHLGITKRTLSRYVWERMTKFIGKVGNNHTKRDVNSQHSCHSDETNMV